MRNFLISSLSVVSIFTYSLPAFATQATELVVSRVGDTEMSCGQLSQEAVLMQDIISTTEDIKDSTELRGYGISAAGALGSFLVTSVTGGVGIAAAGYLLKETATGRSDEADNIQDIAKQRRTLMVGIYNAKGCSGPMEHAFKNELKESGDPAVLLASIEPAAGEEESEETRFNQ